MNNIETINDWFDRHFGNLLLPLPQESDKLLSMGVQRIMQFRSYDHSETGVVALTISDDLVAVAELYEFCKSKEAVEIRESFGIERHWFLIFGKNFQVMKYGRNLTREYPNPRYLVEELDEIWLGGQPCGMWCAAGVKTVIAA
jgi:hypothetical protein